MLPNRKRMLTNYTQQGPTWNNQYAENVEFLQKALPTPNWRWICTQKNPLLPILRWLHCCFPITLVATFPLIQLNEKELIHPSIYSCLLKSLEHIVWVLSIHKVFLNQRKKLCSCDVSPHRTQPKSCIMLCLFLQEKRRVGKPYLEGRVGRK